MRINCLSIHRMYAEKRLLESCVSHARDKRTFNRAQNSRSRNRWFLRGLSGIASRSYFIYYQTTRNERSEVSFIGLNVGSLLHFTSPLAPAGSSFMASQGSRRWTLIKMGSLLSWSIVAQFFVNRQSVPATSRHTIDLLKWKWNVLNGLFINLWTLECPFCLW